MLEMEVDNMKNRIVMYSGGKGSFAVADYVKTHYPDDNILLYFTDTKWEHPDLYRFLYEGADALELPLLIHADGRDPVQLMFENRVLFNSRIGQCSIVLKAGVSSDYIRKGKVPNEEKWFNKEYLKSDDILDEPILYFGIDWTEEHRSHAIKKNWAPYQVELPLIDNTIDEDEVLAKYSIKQPRLYELGFQHNNCFGRCVKAGQGHFKNLHAKLPEVFQKTKEQEHYLRVFVSMWHGIKDIEEDLHFTKEDKKALQEELDAAYRPYFYYEAEKPEVFIAPSRMENYSFMKRMRNKVTAPYALRDLEADIKEEPQQIDMFDIGGCGCFIDM